VPGALDYNTREKDPPWNLPAVVGFALCLAGLPAGWAIANVFEDYAPSDHGIRFLVLMLLPLAGGITLCVIGVFQTATARTPARGNALASAGLFAALCWMLLGVLFFFVALLRLPLS